jgi:uncharacterized membrane protein
MKDVFCGKCGAKMDLSISDTCPSCGYKAETGGAETSSSSTGTFSGGSASGDVATFGLKENVASALCYLLGCITGIIFILVEKDNHTVRFHAMQSILTFLPLGILGWIIGMMAQGAGEYGSFGIWTAIGLLITIIEVILWLVLIVKAYQGEEFMVPIVGSIAMNHI